MRLSCYRYRTRITIFCLSCFALSILYLITAPIDLPAPADPESLKLLKGHQDVHVHSAQSVRTSKTSAHKLAVVVPFRDVWPELMAFVPYIHEFLNNQSIQHNIYVINQVDILRFNRASLINIGFLLSQDDGCDYIAMHDVDLLPLNPELSYAYPSNGPFHVASPEFHPKYNYPKFVGGILLLTAQHFKLVNGMSNRYWGWGLEDDEFYTRLMDNELEITRPIGIKTGNKTLLHIHNGKERKRDYKKYGRQKQITRTLDRITGLDTVHYDIVSHRTLHIDGAPAYIYDIQLYCDVSVTEWCITEEMLQAYQSGKLKDTPSYITDGGYV